MKGYVKELDSLRAFSVLAVILHHYLFKFKFFSVFGLCGVTMFFVLSGYLISSILLNEKKRFSVIGIPRSRGILKILKTFYVRRALRIFPLYYLVLLILIAINLDSARKYWEYHVFYL